MFGWLDQIRTRTAAPVVIVSAHPASVFAGWAERGYAAVLPKPFDIEALSALVRLLCGAPDGHG
jgi:DNA-binding response OmpR family regulator